MSRLRGGPAWRCVVDMPSRRRWEPAGRNPEGDDNRAMLRKPQQRIRGAWCWVIHNARVSAADRHRTSSARAATERAPGSWGDFVMLLRRRAVTATGALVLLLSGVAGTTSAHADPAQDLYVNQSAAACTDTGAGTQSVPFCTIQAAADAALPGQTVHIVPSLGKLYTQPVTITHSGTPGAPITFAMAADAEGDDIRPVKAAAFTVRNAHDIDFSGLSVGTSAPFPGFQLIGAHRIRLDDELLYDAGDDYVDPQDAIDVDGTSSDVTVARTEVHQFTGWGLNVQAGAGNIVVTDSMFNFEGGRGEGGIHADGVAGIVVTGDSLSSTCGRAVDITGSSSGSIENVVAQWAGGQTGCPLAASPAEIAVSADSVANVRSDYNAVQAQSPGEDYLWGGAPYASSAAFTAATGQGAHDLDHMGVQDSYWPTEGSPLIDSGDADAPDELASDRYDRPRVDDPLVPDTGVGVVDRGAVEFHALQGLKPVMSVDKGPAPLAETVTLQVTNPWNAAITGYRFDFGDGSAPTETTTPSATHTYTAVGFPTVTVIATNADGTTFQGTTTFDVSQTLPLVPEIGVSRQGLTVSVSGNASDDRDIAQYTYDFGDGSAPQTASATPSLSLSLSSPTPTPRPAPTPSPPPPPTPPGRPRTPPNSFRSAALWSPSGRYGCWTPAPAPEATEARWARGPWCA
ncbi:PKD domain-containing protein [Streptacidiphilus cavernicola]|uniref:PKD domain-containing protein n=1 Tax=Streptacidiphilus cavernicola TaxID=3342716 RepID=A0ABV6W4I2_9ACTN